MLTTIFFPVSVKHLRDFLETVPLASNNNQPLNPSSDRRNYLIICTHCHYDHIGGIAQFIPKKGTKGSIPIIVASATGKDFIESDLPEHSLCRYNRIPTPRYTVQYWAKDFERLRCSFPRRPSGHETAKDLYRRQYDTVDLGITIINTPGHTPDELAWYDDNERHLYVGDSFYERGTENMAIIFPKEGDWIDYMSSMQKLLDFVQRQNEQLSATEDTDEWIMVPKRVKIGCGHTTTSVDGEQILVAVLSLFTNIIHGKIPVRSSKEIRGEIHDFWREDSDEARFSVRGPRRLCEEMRKKTGLAEDGANIPEPQSGLLSRYSQNIPRFGLF